MKIKIIIIIAVSILIFIMLNWYIGLKGWEILRNYKTANYKALYWIIFWFAAFSFIIAKATYSFMPDKLSNGLTLVGDYWIAIMLYSFLCFGIMDILKLVVRKINIIPDGLKNNSFIGSYAGILIVVLVAAILVYGTWNANHPLITKYNIDVNKKAGKYKALNVAMVSDIHLGEIMDRNRLCKMVDMINSLNPDIVVIAGDITDGDISMLERQDMKEVFKKLHPKLGTYAIPGNHDYMGQGVNAFIDYMDQSNITVLADSYVEIDKSFYLAGRRDVSGERNSGRKRDELSDILKGVDKSMPVILMDHQPSSIESTMESGVDIMLSGHTHKGQLAPSQIVTGLMFEIDWGMLKKNNLNVIVSSGFGTWGPPIRVGNHPEVVDIKVQFKN